MTICSNTSPLVTSDFLIFSPLPILQGTEHSSDMAAGPVRLSQMLRNKFQNCAELTTSALDFQKGAPEIWACKDLQVRYV